MLNKESVCLYDMYELVKHPEFNKLMAMKVGQIKNCELQADIDTYNEKRENHFQWLTLKLTADDTFEENEALYPTIYRFDLTQFGKMDWGVTSLDPYPPPHVPYFEVLPQQVINAIALNCKEDLRSARHLDAVYSKEYNQKVDIWFTKMSENHIVGVIREHVAPEVMQWVDQAVDEGDMNVENLKYPYQAMQYSFSCWPQLRTQFLVEFNLILLPKLKKISPRMNTDKH
jgi:hypothetical protein